MNKLKDGRPNSQHENVLVRGIKVRRLGRNVRCDNTSPMNDSKYSDMYKQEENDIDKTVEILKKYAKY